MKTELDEKMNSREMKEAMKQFKLLPKKEQDRIEKENEAISKWFSDRGHFFYPLFLKASDKVSLEEIYGLPAYMDEFCSTFDKSVSEFIGYMQAQKLIVEHTIAPFKVNNPQKIKIQCDKSQKETTGGIGSKNIEALKRLKESIKESK